MVSPPMATTSCASSVSTVEPRAAIAVGSPNASLQSMYSSLSFPDASLNGLSEQH
jgi:hypothetical protein